MDIVSRDIDLQRIRKDHKVTQQRLAELTKYPQSFISQIENRRVNAPAAFQKVLMEVLDISSLEPYYLPAPGDEKFQNENAIRNDELRDQQLTINRLLDIIDRRDERIRELENDLRRMQEIILNRVEK